MAFYKDPREGTKRHTQFPFSSHYDQRDSIVAHYHEMIELLYFVKGECSVFLGNKSYKIHPGDLLIINSGEIHSMYSNECAEFIVVQVDPEFLYSCDKTKSKIEYVYPFLQSNSDNPRLFKKEEIDMLNIGDIMQNILYECTKMEFGFELSAKGDIYKLFFGIIKHLEKQGKITDNGKVLEQDTSNAFDKVFDFVKDNFSTNITAKDAAKVTNLSYSYFSRLFHSVMNTTFTEYLSTVRLAKSEQLLIDTDKSVTDIAIECGFSTTSYFILKFRKKNNISPLGFRKKFKR